jgi:prolipoprotein diacylglyceryltransferase
MLMMAFLTCNFLLKKYLESINKDKKVGEDIIFYAALGGISGAKIYYILEYYNSGEGHNNIIGFLNIFKGIFSLDVQLLWSGIQTFGSGLVFLTTIIEHLKRIFL